MTLYNMLAIELLLSARQVEVVALLTVTVITDMHALRQLQGVQKMMIVT